MTREISVLLVEDDFYARHWMEMLLRRDWRTRVVGVIKNPGELKDALDGIQKHADRVDQVVIDTEIPCDTNWLTSSLHLVGEYNPEIKIILTGTVADQHTALLLGKSNIVGYVLNDEIRYTLAWAVSLVADHPIVITPGVMEVIRQLNPLPPGSLILDGRNRVANFTKREAEAARLAFMFSMERREMADELKITEEYTYGLVSSLYEKMGLNAILSGEEQYEDIFGNHPAIKKHIQQAVEALKIIESKSDTSDKVRFKKIKDKETLAFHLLTLPEIEGIY